MADILLLEPNYKNKYPPLGLMKISYFHRVILGDFVRFAKGKLANSLNGKKWDRVYVTSLFTFEWEETKKTIEYALTVAKDKSEVYVGGIMATLMPELFKEHFPTIKLVKGLLDKAGLLGLKGDECIDRITPDYSILEHTEYKYPAQDAYFLYMTRGCGMRCEFCAVQTLEPEYIPFISIREQIENIKREFGEKRDLLLMDNNVLISRDFDRIIEEIKALGFAKGAKYKSPVTGKPIVRYVDFNQGLDAKLLSDHKVRRLGELALRPARVAFDHIEDEEIYKRSLELCARNGIKYLSNYILYNGESFTGKGQKYKADTPEDLHQRMKISMDFCEHLNSQYGHDGRVHIFSFPMRYIPLSSTKRGFVGTHWNKKYLRAVQRMLIPTTGKGVSSRSFFEADFGATAEIFMENLAMPEELLGLRGHFVKKPGETKKERDIRYAKWERNHRHINEWRRLYQSLNGDIAEHIKIIGDNDFTMENFANCRSEVQQQLFLHHLSNLGVMRNIEKLGEGILSYIRNDFSQLYEDLIIYSVRSKHTQYSALKGMLSMLGKEFIDDILNEFKQNPYWETNVFDALYKAQKANKKILVDTRYLDIAVRFRAVKVISDKQFQKICELLIAHDESSIFKMLTKKLGDFKEALIAAVSDEIARDVLYENIERIIEKLRATLIVKEKLSK